MELLLLAIFFAGLMALAYNAGPVPFTDDFWEHQGGVEE